MNSKRTKTASYFVGKVAVVTGGSSGIGKQVAKDLSRWGAPVIICSNQPSKLEEAKKGLVHEGHQIDAYECDVRNTENVNRLAEYVVRTYGHVDIVVNNA
jgi:NAD(P)-dependent dehydrogenase (short-subunit alcohol dehydrogenase family)